ncbi:SAM-dependent DNA methyltransferase [cyanobiont of Ornithocercus magnificus]|nr:SAM-dependent DNA methyltransferase [cyanobiont of Ornithocercus magnificus]
MVSLLTWGQELADTFARDQHPGQEFDYILANPPFNISDWGGRNTTATPTGQFGRPPAGNANYAWLQQMLRKLRPGGEAGVVLANGSMSSNNSSKGQIREAMVRGDMVEVMVALPGQVVPQYSDPCSCLPLVPDQRQDPAWSGSARGEFVHRCPLDRLHSQVGQSIC